ncbi:nitric oxide reductase activation-like protein [Acetobacterium fimetarium]|uniref:Nitric oxide reductase activation-like protein n=1 Tax=Acetobacterium fimetarium TaxID=52691 RepID=A0ABR6WTH4_9FIRM|nr:nitric oxide reductase activation-like protein [Acetobacterium fimetarium]MBC3803698.1 nitric oxide reductase activation-like protein [Acetobacterium fimetarium]
MKDAKWIYEDYEFDNRITNLMWTISGDYDENMDRGEKSFISENVALYHAVTAGGRRKFIDWTKVKKYVISRYRAGFDKDIVLGLISMGSDVVVEEKIIAERPGVYDIRKKAYDDIFANYYKLHTNNLMEKVEHAIILEKMGTSVMLDADTSRLKKALLALQHREDTVDFLKGIEAIYMDYFPLFVEADEDEKKDLRDKQNRLRGDFSDFMLEELYDDDPEESEIEASVEELADALLGESQGDMSNGSDGQSGTQILRVQEEDLEKIYEKVAYYYGSSFLPISEVKKLQNRVCQGEHGNCRIHMTDGVIRSDSRNEFQQKYVKRQQTKNVEVFRANFKICKRNVNKLKESMSRTLVQEEIMDAIPSDAGLLVANKLWRINRSSNHKVFVKNIDNNKGSFVVDILMDSSGSQRRNQSKVAIQSYIIAQALTLVGIPNRVLGFSSFLDYTVIKRFRDYESPLSANDNIFEYFCSGNNRDGLAIKATCEDLLKRREDNKILIVLSDGRPNDIKVGKGQVDDVREAYRGRVAIADTAREVRLARQLGIMVLGVFTGKEQDLMAEKLIYGKDFAYIKDINRFADLVIKYLKQIIAN